MQRKLPWPNSSCSFVYMHWCCARSTSLANVWKIDKIGRAHNRYEWYWKLAHERRLWGKSSSFKRNPWCSFGNEWPPNTNGSPLDAASRNVEDPGSSTTPIAPKSGHHVSQYTEPSTTWRANRAKRIKHYNWKSKRALFYLLHVVYNMTITHWILIISKRHPLAQASVMFCIIEILWSHFRFLWDSCIMNACANGEVGRCLYIGRRARRACAPQEARNACKWQQGGKEMQISKLHSWLSWLEWANKKLTKKQRRSKSNWISEQAK